MHVKEFHVSKELPQYAPKLQPEVDSLLSVSDSLLHKLSLWWIGKAFWALNMSGMLSNIPIISLHPFSMAKLSEEALTKDSDVIETTTRIGTIDPNHISSLDAQRNFVPQTTLLLEFVAGKTGTMLWYSKVNTVNAHEAISSTVAFEPVLKKDLDKQK